MVPKIINKPDSSNDRVMDFKYWKRTYSLFCPVVWTVTSFFFFLMDPRELGTSKPKPVWYFAWLPLPVWRIGFYVGCGLYDEIHN